MDNFRPFLDTQNTFKCAKTNGPSNRTHFSSTMLYINKNYRYRWVPSKCTTGRNIPVIHFGSCVLSVCISQVCFLSYHIKKHFSNRQYMTKVDPNK